MEGLNDGGPAFPRTEDAICHKNRDFNLDGMSLRDYFATHAVQGLAACPESVGTPQQLATVAYEIADAMLKARLANVDSPRQET